MNAFVNWKNGLWKALQAVKMLGFVKKNPRIPQALQGIKHLGDSWIFIRIHFCYNVGDQNISETLQARVWKIV